MWVETGIGCLRVVREREWGWRVGMKSEAGLPPLGVSLQGNGRPLLILGILDMVGLARNKK